MIADIVKALPRKVDPDVLADAVIAHIEHTLPEILSKLKLQPKMSMIERFRLEGRSGFRPPKKTFRGSITKRLEREDKLAMFRGIRSRVAQRESQSSMASFSDLSRSLWPVSSSDMAPAVATENSTAVVVGPPWLVRRSATATNVRMISNDASAMIPFDIDVPSAIRPEPLGSTLIGADLRGKFVVIHKGKLVRLSESKFENLPRASQQIQIPNEQLYANLQLSSLLSAYTRLRRSGDKKTIHAPFESKLTEVLLEALQLEEQWEVLNRRRFYLITKSHTGGLRGKEASELERLQRTASQRADLLAPFPLSTLEALREYAERIGSIDPSKP